jgi:hypothetical protein
MMAYNASGVLPEELESAPVLPDLAVHVWKWFLELSRGRDAGFAANPLKYSEIEAWCRLSGTRLEPWEIRAICRLDMAYFEGMDSK